MQDARRKMQEERCKMQEERTKKKEPRRKKLRGNNQELAKKEGRVKLKKHNFKNLIIWQRAMDFTDGTFLYCADLPVSERFNLIDQINRASCSIPTNIAEGSGKRTKIHFAEFLTTSLTSAYEIETQLLICQRRKFGNEELLNNLLTEVTEIQKMIFSFREGILNGED